MLNWEYDGSSIPENCQTIVKKDIKAEYDNYWLAGNTATYECPQHDLCPVEMCFIKYCFLPSWIICLLNKFHYLPLQVREKGNLINFSASEKLCAHWALLSNELKLCLCCSEQDLMFLLSLENEKSANESKTQRSAQLCIQRHLRRIFPDKISVGGNFHLWNSEIVLQPTWKFVVP